MDQHDRHAQDNAMKQFTDKHADKITGVCQRRCENGVNRAV